jgi:adenine-specific DNA methylase
LIGSVFPGLFCYKELNEADYFGFVAPWAKLARKYYLQAKLDRIEEARLAQCDDKVYKKEVQRLASDLAKISRRPLTAKDYSANWQMLKQIANGGKVNE